jgi:hypothetical protein
VKSLSLALRRYRITEKKKTNTIHGSCLQPNHAQTHLAIPVRDPLDPSRRLAKYSRLSNTRGEKAISQTKNFF